MLKNSKASIDYTLYVITDRDLMSSPTIEDSVREAISGGATIIQLREKDATSGEFYDLALRVKAITEKAAIPLIINDRLDIAIAVDAEGVHIGQSDLPCAVARRILGPEKIIGVSATHPEQAIKAEKDGADYLGVGAMYPTSTKTDADITTRDELKEITESVDIPVVVIGGVNEESIPTFKGSGIQGFSIVSAVVAAKDVKLAAETLKKLAKDTLA